MTWKDGHREDKEASGLTWAEYHERNFVHVGDLDDAGETLADLRDHVESLEHEYRGLKREFYELRLLLEQMRREER